MCFMNMVNIFAKSYSLPFHHLLLLLEISELPFLNVALQNRKVNSTQCHRCSINFYLDGHNVLCQQYSLITVIFSKYINIAL